MSYSNNTATSTATTKNNSNNDIDEDDEDDEYWDDDVDEVWEQLKAKRLEEWKRCASSSPSVTNPSKAAEAAKQCNTKETEYRTITQDEFLPLTTVPGWVVIHFYHKEFPTCHLMDETLQRISASTDASFLRIEASKAPFFCAKLAIRTLPTVLILRGGHIQDRLIGWDSMSSGHQDVNQSVISLSQWLHRNGVSVQMDLEHSSMPPIRSKGKPTIRHYDEE
jgi:hypothetical protein